jgi:hypothetical protein
MKDEELESFKVQITDVVDAVIAAVAAQRAKVRTMELPTVEEMARAMAGFVLFRDGINVDGLLSGECWWQDWVDEASAVLALLREQMGGVPVARPTWRRPCERKRSASTVSYSHTLAALLNTVRDHRGAPQPSSPAEEGTAGARRPSGGQTGDASARHAGKNTGNTHTARTALSPSQCNPPQSTWNTP